MYLAELEIKDTTDYLNSPSHLGLYIVLQFQIGPTYVVNDFTSSSQVRNK